MTTTIAWTDETWNPIRAARWVDTPAGATFKRGWHCERVSGGCVNCYAERQNVTMARGGTGLPYNRKSREMVDIYLDEKTLMEPLHWKKPRRIFVCSMTDVFGEWVSDEWLDRMFAVMALSPQHTYQVLTKRSARMREYLTATDREPVSGAPTRNQIAMTALGMCLDDLAVHSKSTLGDGLGIARHDGLQDWPLPNVWLGVSAEDQERADERIPDLLATPAAVRFLSCEPLLGPLALRPYVDFSDGGHGRAWLGAAGPAIDWVETPQHTFQVRSGATINWVIVGGESGPGARAFDLAWVRSLRDQCAAAGTAFFMKQTGENAFDSTPGTTFSLTAYRKRKSRHGEDPEEWPADLRVREWPGVRS